MHACMQYVLIYSRVYRTRLVSRLVIATLLQLPIGYNHKFCFGLTARVGIQVVLLRISCQVKCAGQLASRFCAVLGNNNNNNKSLARNQALKSSITP